MCQVPQQSVFTQRRGRAGEMGEGLDDAIAAITADHCAPSCARRQHSLTDGVETSTFIGRRVERPILSPAVVTLAV